MNSKLEVTKCSWCEQDNKTIVLHKAFTAVTASRMAIVLGEQVYDHIEKICDDCVVAKLGVTRESMDRHIKDNDK